MTESLANRENLVKATKLGIEPFLHRRVLLIPWSWKSKSFFPSESVYSAVCSFPAAQDSSKLGNLASIAQEFLFLALMHLTCVNRLNFLSILHFYFLLFYYSFIFWHFCPLLNHPRSFPILWPPNFMSSLK